MIRTDDGHDEERRVMERLDRIVGDTLIAAMIVIGLLFCLGAARAAEPGFDPSESGRAPSDINQSIHV